MNDYKFGLGTVDDLGCGAIAIYNARVALRDTRPLRDIIFYCDMYGEYALGYLGAKSNFVADYFKLYVMMCIPLYSWDKELYEDYKNKGYE